LVDHYLLITFGDIS